MRIPNLRTRDPENWVQWENESYDGRKKDTIYFFNYLFCK